MAAVTLYDVAAKAGVSQPTASRVLNGSSRRPSPAVVEAVRRAAAELGYVANAQAQALARSSTALLGLVVHDITDPYFSSIAAGVQQVAAAHGRQVMLAVTLGSPGQELAAVRSFIAHRADAIVLVGSRWRTPEARSAGAGLEQDLKRYRGNGGRVAVVGQALAGMDAVVPGNRTGGAALARALLADGVRDYIILSGPRKLVTAADRTAGFVAALGAQGVEALSVVEGAFTRDGGYTAAQSVVERCRAASRPVCLFAVTDVMALGAMVALREAGLRVPNDVQVAGFDDITTLRDHTPALTTVRLPLQEMGARAVELVLADGVTGQRITRVAGQVVLRDSTTSAIRAVARR